MKEKFKKIQFLVYSVLLFALASALESYLSGLKTFDIDTGRITRVLHAKETRADSLLSDIRAKVENGNETVHENSIYVLQENLETIEQEGISVYVFEKDTLRYWTGNKAPIKKIYSQSGINNRIAKLSNGWYEIRTVVKGDKTYVALILLKSEYTIENKYLSKGFEPEFHLSPTFKISSIALSYGVDIQDKEGKYIFSLVPLNEVDPDAADFTWVGVLFLLSLVSLLLFVLNYINLLAAKKGNALIILSIICSVILIRIACMLMKLPPNVYSLDFFDPVYFQGGFLFPTFGDFLINAVFMLFATVAFFKLADYVQLRDNIRTWTEFTRGCFFFAIALVGVYAVVVIHSALESLIADSDISFQLTNVFKLDVFSVAGIGIFALIFASLIYAIVRITSYVILDDSRQLRKALIIIAASGVVAALIAALADGAFLCATMLYVATIVIAACLMHYARATESIYRYMFMVFLSAALSSVVITHTAEQKHQHISEEHVMQAADEHDKIAELLLKDFTSEVSGDALISDYLAADIKNGSRLYDYLQRWHFNGYWNKYNLAVKVFEAVPGVPFLDMQNDIAESVKKYGSEVPFTDFYFVDNPDGGISYVGQLRATVNDDSYYIIIVLDNKPVPDDFGYPELLVNGQIISSQLEGCNYAKYRNGKRTKQNGSYSYDLSDNMFVSHLTNDDTIAVFSSDSFVHTVYKASSDIVVISRPQISIIDYVVSFAYLFCAYTLFVLIYIGIKVVVEHKIDDYRSQLKIKLVGSVCVILVLAFIIVCGAMAYFNTLKFRQDTSNEINDKMKSVYMHIEQAFGDSTAFVSQKDSKLNILLDEYLAKTAHVFFTDINIYGADGELVGSSRPEIFKKGIISTQINGIALKALVFGTKANYIQEETIGNMSYTSAYIPFYNSHDKLTGYINLPYFSKPDVMKSELSTMLVSLTNLFVVLMLLSIVIAVVLSERMVHPIRMIQNMMEKVELGKKHEKIEYSRKDEIGQLVSEYNNMVEKLEESAALLAKSERESAWREMAKQIAHEIKNPLTPMKLSIQFLIRSHQNHDADFDDKLEKVSNTLIQQIDTLSSIATGFSNFAKMPKPDESPFNVVETLSNVVQLFTNTENMEITSDLGGHSNITIVADKEQISRVFVNLIKNATQAIPDGIKGKIHVSLGVADGKVTVKIKDNGCGIPDEIKGKLFTPSFTTKSSGSGLGLAMCKNIIINAKGDISFESEVGKGTTFIVTLPVKK